MVFETVVFQKRAQRIHNISCGGKTLEAFNEIKRATADIGDRSIHLTALPKHTSLHQGAKRAYLQCVKGILPINRVPPRPQPISTASLMANRSNIAAIAGLKDFRDDARTKSCGNIELSVNTPASPTVD